MRVSYSVSIKFPFSNHIRYQQAETPCCELSPVHGSPHEGWHFYLNYFSSDILHAHTYFNFIAALACKWTLHNAIMLHKDPLSFCHFEGHCIDWHLLSGTQTLFINALFLNLKR